MGVLLYVRLIGFTFGALLQLFWMVVILGYRRQRHFERVFFFLCLALFFFYSGSLLALNAQIYYATSASPPLLTAFAKILLCAGLCFLPPLLIHLHVEYAETRGNLGHVFLKRILLFACYAPALYFALRAYPVVAGASGFDFLIPGNALGRGYGAWLAAAMIVSAAWEAQFTRQAPDKPQQWFHSMLTAVFVAGATSTFYLHVLGGPVSPIRSDALSTTASLLAILPSATLIYLVYRFNFLQIGRQKNLVYAVSATFLALLYLALVRRLSVWLEPALPPEATASILLFVLVIFFEPLQRVLARSLQETAQREMDRVQRLTAEIQQEARTGNLQRLVSFIQERVQAEFELAAVTLRILEPSKAALRPVSDGELGKQATPSFADQLFPIRHKHGRIALLRAEPHGAGISGETRAALEFLCEQLPAAIDLCRLIEEKLRLERELAERERLALLGQMAASISHNLKNPLGSIKTILQVQMENPELPESLRGETKMVLGEIGRLSAKLNQLLQFSRPAVRGGITQATCDVGAVIEEVVGVLKHEAERRGVALEVQPPQAEARMAAGADAVGDIVSNLLVNALEATPRSGRVTLSTESRNGSCVLTVEDNGPGIAPGIREKITQPFFTTKAQGTGLGLAIVARRVAEFGGEFRWESPIKEGCGARFAVTLPLDGSKGVGKHQRDET